MKHCKFKSTVILAILMLSLFSCHNSSEDMFPEPDQIHILDLDRYTIWNSDYNTIYLPLYEAIAHQYEIAGGDGHYIVTGGSNMNDFAELSYNGEFVTLKPKAVGKTVMSIRDNSGNKLTLHIDISYPFDSFRISPRFTYFIDGENLTVKEYNEIKADIKPTFPTNTLGVYRFIYTQPQRDRGDIEIYSDWMGSGNYINGTFTTSGKLHVNEDLRIHYKEHTITTEDTTLVIKHFNYNDIMPDSRMSMPPMYDHNSVFIEDQTEKYKEKYPAVEKVYVTQFVN